MRTRPSQIPSPSAIPSSDDIRQGLIDRVNEFVRLTGMTKSEIGKRAVQDVAFISELEAGRNITLKSYERLRAFLDEHWPKNGAAPDNQRSPS